MKANNTEKLVDYPPTLLYDQYYGKEVATMKCTHD